MHFIIVDDNRLLVRFLATYLRSKGHEVTPFTNSTKVLPFLRVQKSLPDAMVLDIGMPELDGYDILGLLIEGSFALPVVIFTGLGYDGTDAEAAMAKCRRLGAVGYVSKGLGASEIYSALIRALTSKG
jgi:DNA-binding response OmpR family regulator